MNEGKRQEALAEVKQLVAAFSANKAEFTRHGSDYNETLVRQDFINPFLRMLGWDVDNTNGDPLHLREVFHEPSVDVEEEEGAEKILKKPDYAIRVNGRVKFYIEAKRPSVKIQTHKSATFQLRRYGWTARLPMSVLTNFHTFVIYDTRFLPHPADEPHVARLKVYSYEEYVTKFDEIYDLISREAVYSEQFDKHFSLEKEGVGQQPFDEYFLEQIQSWRERLAADLARHNPELTQDELNFLVQRLINRIVFLRICEDRNLETYKTLQKVTAYQQLKELFLRADQKYNSGLFNFIEDALSLNVNVGSDVLVEIFKELYYPESPYAFSVLDAGVLGEIYELFLGKSVTLSEDRSIEIVDKPEVVESGGVVPTPRFIVDAIVRKNLSHMLRGKTPEQLSPLRISDIACGSGIFLLAAYEHLLNYHLEWYLNEGPAEYHDKLRQDVGNQWYLSLHEKQRILLNNIYGVDIDIQAAEVTRFSLMLKVLENESEATVNAHLSQYGQRALPNLDDHIKCGNSLVDHVSFKRYDPAGLTSEEELTKINPFTWEDEFADIMRAGGFDVILGNPPYIRIQNMVKYSIEEAKFYQSKASSYLCAKADNFDKYMLFIEKGLMLLNERGFLGYIVPHKFFKLKSGRALRELLADGRHVAEVVHFGVQQVFGKRTTTYTCILLLTKSPVDQLTVEHVSNLASWRYGQLGSKGVHSTDELSEDPWSFLPPEVKALFDRLKTKNTVPLGKVANIFVGVQTSADKIYIIRPRSENARTVTFVDRKGTEWTVEKRVLRPCLLDAPLECFGAPEPNSWIIFPYQIVGDKAVLCSEQELRSLFPRCWEYLKAYKSDLENRNVQNYTPDTWYRYGRSQSLTKFNGEPKLIWPVLSLEPRYAYDKNNIMFTGGGNGPYYALRPETESRLSIFYLQAILSHPIFEAMIQDKSSKFRGGYGSHGKQFIVGIPIRRINFEDEREAGLYAEIDSLVKQLIRTTQQAAAARTPERRKLQLRAFRDLRRHLNKAVDELYGISRQDLKLVGAFVEDGDEEEDE